MSKFDKQLESYAKALGIPVEQARRALEAGLKKQGYSCTCKETPGICKVHA
jgi:shikimate kinase